MISLSLIEEVVTDQTENLKRKKIGVPRRIDVSRMLETKQITVVSGIRRSGKSTLLYQLMSHYDQFHFINFDDERLIDFKVEDFRTLMAVFRKKSDTRTIFIDEVQNVVGWERFVRRVYDEEYKIFVTGSNAKLLSSELGTHLTGRYIKLELFPFSFSEYLDFLQFPEDREESSKGTWGKANILKAFDNYLVHGGFPEYLTQNDSEYLSRIYEDILFRDLIVRYGIKNTDAFRKLAQYLFTNFTSEFSYNKLAELLGFASVNSVKEYMLYLQECYLLFQVHKFDFSLKKQFISNKKVYCIDNGLRERISLRFSPDNGRLLENLVYIELRRRGFEVYFYKTKNNLEVDFYVPALRQFIQVSYLMENETTYQREINALKAAISDHESANNLIITYNEESTIPTPAGAINVVPIWKWLLEIT